MGLTTIVMFIGSLGFLLLSLYLFKSKNLRKKIAEGILIDNPEKYIKTNGIFYLTIGIVGSILTILNLTVPNLSKIFVIIFVVIMIISSIYQSLISKKFKEKL